MTGRDCRRCGRELLPGRNARRLCGACWSALRRSGDLADYPRVNRSRDDLLDAYVVLRGRGLTWRECAAELGMAYPALQRAIFRARADGDERAAPTRGRAA